MTGHVAPQRQQIESQAKALVAAHAALEKQAEDVVVVDLRSLSIVTDFFVICTAGSSRQITALKEHIDTLLFQRGYPVWHTEGDAAASPSRGFTPTPGRQSVVWGFTCASVCCGDCASACVNCCASRV